MSDDAEPAAQAKKFDDPLIRYITRGIKPQLEDEAMAKSINRSIIDDIFEEIEYDDMFKIVKIEYHGDEAHNMFKAFISLRLIEFGIEECTTYFRTFPFNRSKINRSNYLRNCCEMYLDRIYQYKDRFKLVLNLCHEMDESSVSKEKISSDIKAFDSVFSWELRYRNMIHHGGRYNDKLLSQISLVETLSSVPEFPLRYRVDLLSRKARKFWKRRIEHQSEKLGEFSAMLAEVIAHFSPEEDEVTVA